MSRWLLVVLVGCAVPRGGLPEFDEDAGIDSSIDAPMMDVPGVDAPGVDAPGVDAMTDSGMDAFDAAIDSGCGAIGVRSCAESTLQECTPAGLTDVRECLRGCASGFCTPYDVRNVDVNVLLHSGTAAFTIGAGQTVFLNTDDGEIILDPDMQLRPPGVGVMNGISFERQGQTGAPGLGIFSFDSLTIESGGLLRARGSDVPVILVGGDAIIDGTIDVSASGQNGGVGGSNGGPRDADGGGGAAGGEGGEQVSVTQLSGGGGGGHAANGGRGGNDRGAQGGQGGMTIADSGGTPLIGGGGGGGGGQIAGDGSHGGGGGGAVQVSAGTSLTVGASGIVRASGAGGDSGWSAGGGGGAGGSIVLEAPTLDVDGIVVSNGGGGGGGLPALGSADDGEAGRLDRGRAQGGQGSGGGKDGGDGGSADNITGEDGQGGEPAGGGGGAAGRVSFYADGGGLSVSGTISPDPTMGAIP